MKFGSNGEVRVCHIYRCSGGARTTEVGGVGGGGGLTVASCGVLRWPEHSKGRIHTQTSTWLPGGALASILLVRRVRLSVLLQ